jgi:hypothetical protein
VVKDDKEHGGRAEKDGESVEIIIGNHLGCRFGGIGETGVVGEVVFALEPRNSLWGKW